MVSGFNLCGLHCRIACGEVVIIIDELAHNNNYNNYNNHSKRRKTGALRG